ncbi:hypothetical protein PoB_005298900 [Plakobranchus ocellatus]|uniref:SMB domain-containing protein n=1 Tax=Plakobranchus ocellatus TaxID=259542 RepID=A0AAV4C611_9GAST|nr:hypothetical protein PoB_005298900 [Plakobranchus ocellatus]
MKFLPLPIAMLLAELVIVSRIERTRSEEVTSSSVFPDYSSPGSKGLFTLSTRSFFRDIRTELLDFVQSMRFCEANLSYPYFSPVGCKGRCGEPGMQDAHVRICSCDFRCPFSGTCCGDFSRECPALTDRYASTAFSKRLTAECGIEGIQLITGCRNHRHREHEIEHNMFNSLSSKTFGSNVHSKKVIDYLGRSRVKIEDREYGLIFPSRKIYEGCKFPDSSPAVVPRKVFLSCKSLINNSTLELLEQARGSKEETEKYKNTILNHLLTFLDGCNVTKVVDERTDSMQQCHLVAAMECFTSSTKVLSATIVELCDMLPLRWSEVQYLQPTPYILYSEQAKYVTLKSGTPCFYYIPDANESLKSNTSQINLRQTAIMTVTETFEKKAKEATNEVFDIDSQNITIDQNNTIIIDALGLETTLECPSLNVSLNECLVRSIAFKPETLSASLKEPKFSLSVDLQHAGDHEDTSRDKDTIPRVFPMCTCLKIVAAFESLNFFDAKMENFNQKICVIQLQLSETSVTKVDWFQALQMTIGQTNQTQWSRGGEVALNRTEWNPDQLSENPKSEEKAGPNFATRSGLMKVLHTAEDIKIYIESYMQETSAICPYDNLESALICFAIYKQWIGLFQETKQECDAEKCSLLDLSHPYSEQFTAYNNAHSPHPNFLYICIPSSLLIIILALPRNMFF